MTENEVKALLTEEGKRFFNEVKQQSPDDILLKYHGTIAPDLLRGVAEQLKCTAKLEKKQPAFYNAGAFCELSVLEQSTPEPVAQYRKSLMSGNRLCDCTGGMGVDTIALHTNFSETTFCEIESARMALFRHNSERLNASEIATVLGDSMAFLESCEDKSFDWLFLDPARRDGTGKRFITLDQCMPNVIEHAELLRRKSKNIAMKLAPAFEISELPKIFPDLSRCIVISYNSEVREILITIEEGRYFTTPESVVIVGDTSSSFRGDDSVVELYGESLRGNYLYEPDGAIIKAGIVNTIASQYKLKRLHSRGVFLVSDRKIDFFPGRVFHVKEQLQWQRKQVGKYLKKNQISHAAVVRRDFPLKPEELRKMYHLGESGEQFLIFTVDAKDKRIVIDAVKQ